MSTRTGKVHMRVPFSAALGVALLAGGSWTVALAIADEEPEELVRKWFAGLTEQFGGLDWEHEYPFIARAIENVWARNGWNEEADRYARDLVNEVAAIPPWEFRKRFDLFTRRVGERYQLTPLQIERFQRLVMREIGRILPRHSGVILGQAIEALKTRGASQPFTAEQVARWTKAGEPLFKDARASFDFVAREFSSGLTAGQRRIWDRDLAAANKRWNDIETARGRWIQGGWQADDWGLQGDPIQQGTGRGAAVEPPRAVKLTDGAGAPAQVERLPRWRAYDPSTWFAYVLDFEKRFNLDDGQTSAARSIHAELVGRAAAYTQAHAEQMRKVPPDERDTNEAYAPIRAYFTELQARLEAIPTTAQRNRESP